MESSGKLIANPESSQFGLFVLEATSSRLSPIWAPVSGPLVAVGSVPTNTSRPSTPLASLADGSATQPVTDSVVAFASSPYTGSTEPTSEVDPSASGPGVHWLEAATRTNREPRRICSSWQRAPGIKSGVGS